MTLRHWSSVLLFEGERNQKYRELKKREETMNGKSQFKHFFDLVKYFCFPRKLKSTN